MYGLVFMVITVLGLAGIVFAEKYYVSDGFVFITVVIAAIGMLGVLIFNCAQTKSGIAVILGIFSLAFLAVYAYECDTYLISVLVGAAFIITTVLFSQVDVTNLCTDYKLVSETELTSLSDESSPVSLEDLSDAYVEASKDGYTYRYLETVDGKMVYKTAILKGDVKIKDSDEPVLKVYEREVGHTKKNTFTGKLRDVLEKTEVIYVFEVPEGTVLNN